LPLAMQSGIDCQSRRVSVARNHINMLLAATLPYSGAAIFFPAIPMKP
jgi:hypothetical protein